MTKEEIEQIRKELEEKKASSKGVLSTDDLKENYSAPLELSSSVIDNLSEETFKQTEYKAIARRDNYEKLDFLNPVECALFFKSAFINGDASYYEWQAQSLNFVVDPFHTKQRPLIYNLLACNGSGKDSYFIADLVVFLLTCKIRSRTVITTKSFKQLQYQTYPGILSYCNDVNKKMREIGLCGPKEDFILVYSGHFVCPKTGSEAILFVTDEPGRAEGYHPFADHKDSELTLIVNEAKSVDRAIFAALKRCTGYCRWINVSSSGVQEGYFFEKCSDSVYWPAPYDPQKQYCRKVTALDCPRHYSPEFLLKEKMDMDEALYMSVYMSEFMGIGENSIFSASLFLSSTARVTLLEPSREFCAGLDLSLGGDETVLYIRQGPDIVALHTWKIKDTIILEQKIAAALSVYGNMEVYVDVGGLGKPIYQHIRNQSSKHIYIPVDNGKPPLVNGKLYANTVAADYFHVKTLMLRGYIKPPKDQITKDQLAARKFEYVTSGRYAGKILLKSKTEMRSEGENSPDRADSYVLCFRRYKFNELNKIEVAKEEKPSNLIVDQDNFFEWLETQRELRLHKNQNNRIRSIRDAIRYNVN